jgi:hypothetical protein
MTQSTRRFTPEQVETIERMVADGHSSVVIARQLNCKPSAVRAKCAALGLTLRRSKPEHGARFSVPKNVYEILAREGAARGMSANSLAAKLLTIIAEDDMTTTMIDNLTEVPAVPDARSTSPAHADGRSTSTDRTPAVAISVSLTALRCPELQATMP